MAKKPVTPKPTPASIAAKSIKISRIAAKAVVRVLLFLILMAFVPFFTNNGWQKRLDKVYIVMPNKWVLVYPAIVVIGFISIFIVAVRQKFSKADVNWLLVVSTLVLIACGVTFAIRLSHLLH